MLNPAAAAFINPSLIGATGVGTALSKSSEVGTNQTTISSAQSPSGGGDSGNAVRPTSGASANSPTASAVNPSSSSLDSTAKRFISAPAIPVAAFSPLVASATGATATPDFSLMFGGLQHQIVAANYMQQMQRMATIESLAKQYSGIWAGAAAAAAQSPAWPDPNMLSALFSGTAHGLQAASLSNTIHETPSTKK
ncbi:unnamed protein product [Toxocara canis]|nr:unnamed protein product [Toxocara canis]